MALPTRITLPPSGRPVGGLLSAARPLDGEWWRGVTFSSMQCAVPQSVGTACAEEAGTTKVPQRPGDEQTFETFAAILAVHCSTLGNTNVAELAEDSLDVVREFSVARELLTGAASGNPSLAGTTCAGPASCVTDNLGTATDPVAALGCLDQTAAEALSGRLAFIHASPAILTAWVAASAVWRDGRLWRTALGSVVVGSAGYDGRAPGGAAPTSGASLYAYATGEVYAAISTGGRAPTIPEPGQRDTLESVDRSVNTATAIAEDVALVVFDPCFIAAIDTTVTLCEEAS